MKPLTEALPDATPDHLWQLEQMFPDIPSPYDPLMRWVVIQDRGVVEKTRGGLWLSDISKEADEYQENIGRVLAVGPLAGYDDLSNDPDPMKRKLPGSPGFEVGDIVLCSRMDSTRQKIVEKDGRKTVIRLVPDRDVKARVNSVSQVAR
jgi:co-chaperonin GroES (HSP10)